MWVDLLFTATCQVGWGAMFVSRHFDIQLALTWLKKKQET